MGCCASRAGRDLPAYSTELNSAVPVDVNRYPLYEDDESLLTQAIAQTVVPLEKSLRDDPVVKYFLPSAEFKLNAALHFWLERLVTNLVEYNLCFETESHAAVACWVPAGARLVDSLGPESEVHLGDKFEEFRDTLSQLDEQREKHTSKLAGGSMHLAMFGTRPEFEGKGHCAVVLQPVLRLCDKDELTAFTHVTTNKSIDFLRKLGFEVCDELILDEDQEARITSMIRHPRPRKDVKSTQPSAMDNPVAL